MCRRVGPRWDDSVVNVRVGLLDAAFGHPRGVLGRVGGALMARGNAEQERDAVVRAQLHEGQHVLVVGHGPGLGVHLAAERVGERGRVTGVDPSPTMRAMAARRCAALIAHRHVVLADGVAEATGAEQSSVDAVVSVNNVMLWDPTAGFTEVMRVLRPGGRLVVSVHRHVLEATPERLRERAESSGLTEVTLTVRPRRLMSPAVDLTARRPPIRASQSIGDRQS